MILTFVGFGELTASWAGALVRRADVEVRVYDRPRPGGRERSAHAAAAGLGLRDDLAGAVGGADVVLACVPAGAAAAVAEACIAHMAAGALYVDPAPVDPAAKRALADRMRAQGVDYVDAALLGTVVASGLELPTTVSGPGAARWAQIGGGLGMRITPIDGEAGRATAIKLVRSVYMKGRDALVLEMLVAARRHGIEREVIRSIAGPGEGIPFDALADRVMGALTVHAGRRADELSASARELDAVGVEPLVTRAAERRLRWMAALELGTGARDDDAARVLDAIDTRTDAS